MRILLALLSLALLRACATDRPIAFTCERMGSFRSEIPVTPPSETSPRAAGSFDEVMKAAFAASARRATASSAGAAGVSTTDVLILSGGGKWGAYGAGLLQAWSAQAAPADRRPEFAVVTGISTGALQSTFAFLGASADQQLVDAYRIEREAQLVRRHGPLFFLSHGSTADISPLRGYAMTRVAPLLDPVAAEAARGRKLFVGAVDALDGKMYAIDLTRIASELQGREREECYVGALLASAAIPVIFRQVTINGVPYFDAGVRHSVFVTGVQAAAARSAKAEGPGRLFVLMNGVTELKEVGSVKPSLLGAGARLRTIVFDQIEKNSIDAASRSAPGLKTFVADIPAEHGCGNPNGDGNPDSDEDIFNPALMACLIEKGRGAFSATSPWKPHPAQPH